MNNKIHQVVLSDLKKEIAFAQHAANCFEENKNLVTFSDGDIVPGCLLAIRWGLLENCVVVVKLDENHIPKNYTGIIKKK